jgi:hypothetical protein
VASGVLLRLDAIIPHGIIGRRSAVAPDEEGAWMWGIAAHM